MTTPELPEDDWQPAPPTWRKRFLCAVLAFYLAALPPVPSVGVDGAGHSVSRR